LLPFKNDVRILTLYPRVFEHLNIPVGGSYEEIGVTEPHPFITLSPCPFFLGEDKVETHPFARFAQPFFIHAVDFQSLFMLRRMLKDEDKRVTLHVNEKSINFLEQKIKVPLSSCIALHTCSADPFRQFPDSFYNDLVLELVNGGYTVVTFGKKEKLYAKINFNHDKLIDLTDQLDLDLLITLISQAGTLITNDSSPLHIASAFDNNIILLTTLKHPDRLLHFRNGKRYHKAIAFYDKLMVDDTKYNLTDSLSDYNSFDSSLFNYKIEDFTPDPHKVFSSVLRLTGR
jgi:hypothetical protein